MDLYHKRSRIIADIFVRSYSNYIVCFTKENDKYELILHNGTIITIHDETKWKDVVEIMEQNEITNETTKRKYDEISM